MRSISEAQWKRVSHEIYPDIVVYDDEGEPETVQYRKVNAMRLDEVQRQHRQIEALLTRLAAVERRLDTSTLAG